MSTAGGVDETPPGRPEVATVGVLASAQDGTLAPSLICVERVRHAAGISDPPPTVQPSRPPDTHRPALDASPPGTLAMGTGLRRGTHAHPRAPTRRLTGPQSHQAPLPPARTCVGTGIDDQGWLDRSHLLTRMTLTVTACHRFRRLVSTNPCRRASRSCPGRRPRVVVVAWRPGVEGRRSPQWATDRQGDRAARRSKVDLTRSRVDSQTASATERLRPCTFRGVESARCSPICFRCSPYRIVRAIQRAWQSASADAARP